MGFSSPTFADDYLTTELKTVTALKKVLAAQQQILQSKQAAVRQLAKDGFASKLEQVAANQSVEFNQQQVAVCDRQIKLLNDLQDSNPKTQQIQVVIFDPSVLIQVPTRTPFVMALDAADQQLKTQLLEAQSAHKKIAESLARSINFQISTLKETIQKLQPASTPAGKANSLTAKFIDAESSVEIRFLNQQLAVHEASVALLKYRTASLRIAHVPTLLSSQGQSLSPADVVALTSTYWNKNLLKSREQSMLSVAKSIGHLHPTQAIQSNWLPESSRPIATAEQANILKRQAQAIAEAANRLQHKLDSRSIEGENHNFEMTAREYSELMSLFADSSSSERQIHQLERHIAALSRIADSDKQIENERDWAIIRLQVLQAENNQDNLIVQTVLRPQYQSTSVRRAEQQNETTDFLASFCDGQLEQFQLHQNVAASKLAEATQQAVRQLHAEGHASWLELRNAETEVLILKEAIVATELQLINSKHRNQILQRLLEVKNNESTVTKI